MDFGPSLAILRSEAESRMLDTVIIEHEDGLGPLDEETMTQPTLYVQDFTSRCRLKAESGQGRDAIDIGGGQVALERLEIHLPWDCPQVRDLAIVRVSAVGPDSDARLIGQRFVVSAPMNGSMQTATRLVVKEAL